MDDGERRIAAWRRQYLVPVADLVTFDPSNAPPAHDDTHLFNVASLAKPVTAWAVLELVASGAVDIDEPANRYLTGWKLRFDGGRECGATLRQLLSHTAGTKAGMPATYESTSDVPDIAASLEIEAVQVVEPPGKRFIYSNAGYAVLEAVVERVAGAPFDAALHDLVLGPLGMHASTFATPKAIDRLHTPHRRAGLPIAPRFSPWNAAGGLYSTAGDVARFAQALTTSPRLHDLVATPPTALGAFGLRNGGYGLGLAWSRDASGLLVVGGQGANQGWKALFAAAPAVGAGFTVTTNSDSGALLLLDALAWWLARAGVTATPRRAVTLARGVAALALTTAVATRRRSGVAIALAAHDTRLLERAGFGPVPLGRLVHEHFPLLLDAVALTRIARSLPPLRARSHHRT